MDVWVKDMKVVVPSRCLSGNGNSPNREWCREEKLTHEVEDSCSQTVRTGCKIKGRDLHPTNRLVQFHLGTVGGQYWPL